nr:MAG TPA: N-acetylmuramoyl-L-alanine amidase [Caudoviricetes sp.]
MVESRGHPRDQDRRPDGGCNHRHVGSHLGSELARRRLGLGAGGHFVPADEHCGPAGGQGRMMEIDSSIRAKWNGGKRKLSAITAIVMHYTANTGQMATAKGNARYFEGGSEGRKASAHYVVDEGETAYECVPLDTVAWSVGDGNKGPYGKLVNNYNSVSIEMVSHTDAAGRYYIPIETQRHAAELYAQLKKQLPNVRYVVRHYDVSLKKCPAPMIDEAAWAKFKNLLEEAEEVRYEKLKDVTNQTYRQTLDKLVEKGLLKGKGGEGEDLLLDLAEDNVRMLVVLDRTGVFGD